jgi:hypothetical protein
MKRDKVLFECFVCGKPMKMAPQHCEGRFLRRYQVRICTPCSDMNRIGWAPRNEVRLLAHLAERGIPFPERNMQGWLPPE